MTDDLDALEAAARAATPDEWIVAALEDTWMVTTRHGPVVFTGAHDQGEADAQFIAAANPIKVRELVARIRELEGAAHYCQVYSIDYGTSCELLAGHDGEHDDGDGCVW